MARTYQVTWMSSVHESQVTIGYNHYSHYPWCSVNRRFDGNLSFNCNISLLFELSKSQHFSGCAVFFVNHTWETLFRAHNQHSFLPIDYYIRKVKNYATEFHIHNFSEHSKKLTICFLLFSHTSGGCSSTPLLSQPGANPKFQCRNSSNESSINVFPLETNCTNRNCNISTITH